MLSRVSLPNPHIAGCAWKLALTWLSSPGYTRESKLNFGLRELVDVRFFLTWESSRGLDECADKGIFLWALFKACSMSFGFIRWFVADRQEDSILPSSYLTLVTPLVRKISLITPGIKNYSDRPDAVLSFVNWRLEGYADIVYVCWSLRRRKLFIFHQVRLLCFHSHLGVIYTTLNAQRSVL